MHAMALHYLALKYGSNLAGCCCNSEGCHRVVHGTEVALAEEGAAAVVLRVRSRESLRVSPKPLVLVENDSAACLGDTEGRHLVVLALVLPVNGKRLTVGDSLYDLPLVSVACVALPELHCARSGSSGGRGCGSRCRCGRRGSSRSSSHSRRSTSSVGRRRAIHASEAIGLAGQNSWVVLIKVGNVANEASRRLAAVHHARSM